MNETVTKNGTTVRVAATDTENTAVRVFTRVQVRLVQLYPEIPEETKE
jgi:hypothetical protein